MRWGFFHPWKTLLTLTMAQDEQLTWTSGRTEDLLSVHNISTGMDGQIVIEHDKALSEETKQEDNWISINVNKNDNKVLGQGDAGETQKSPEDLYPVNEETDQPDLDPGTQDMLPRFHQRQEATVVNLHLHPDETAIFVSSLEETITVLDIDKYTGGPGIDNEGAGQDRQGRPEVSDNQVKQNSAKDSQAKENPIKDSQAKGNAKDNNTKRISKDDRIKDKSSKVTGKDKQPGGNQRRDEESAELHIDCRKLLKWTRQGKHPEISQFSLTDDNLNGNLGSIMDGNPRPACKLGGAKARKFIFQHDKVDPEQGDKNRRSRVGFMDQDEEDDEQNKTWHDSVLVFNRHEGKDDAPLNCKECTGTGLLDEGVEDRTCLTSDLTGLPTNASSCCSSDCDSIGGKLLHDKWRELFDKFDPEGFGEIPWSDFLVALRSPHFLEAVEPGKILLLQDMAVSNADSLLSTAITYQHFVNIMSGKRSRSFKCAVHQRDREVCSESDFHLLPFGYKPPTGVKRMARLIADEFLTDERDRKYYADHYRCLPPPLFIISVTLIELGFFTYYTIWHGEISSSGPLPMDSPFVYRPDKRQEVWRFLFYMVLHAGWVHLMFNLLVQLLVGLPLEMVHGSLRIGCVYMAGVLAGSLGTSVFDPDVYLVGASGGVYALLAAHLANVLLNYNNMEFGLVRLLGVFLIASVDVGYAIYGRYAASPPLTEGSVPPVSYVAHLTGALAGLTIGLLVLKNFEQKLREQLMWWFALGVYAACTLFAILFNVFHPGFPYKN